MNMSTGVFIATHCQGEVGTGVTVVSDPTVNVAPVIDATPDVTPAVWSSGASDTQRWEMADTDAGPWSTVDDMPAIDTPYTDQTFGKVLRWVEAQGGVTAESAAVGPVDLPTTAQLFYWYGGDGATKPAEVVSAGDGQAVSTWEDRGPSSYDVTQATGAMRPTYRLSVSGVSRGGLEFDGDDRLTRNIAGGILANLNTYTLYVVFKTATTNLGAMYAEGRSTVDTPTVVAWLNNPANKAQMFHRDDASTAASPSGGTPNDDAVHVMTVRRGAAGNWSVRLDGTEIATSTAAPGTTTIDRLTIGALVRIGVTASLTGIIFMIAGYSADNYVTVEPALGAHYGVSMPPL